MVVFYYSNFAYPQKNSKKMIPAFKSRIIDMHAHVGNWDNKSFDTNSFDVFLNSKFNKNDSIEKVIVSNLDCINPSIMQDEFVGNSDLLALIKNNPKFEALAVCQPNVTGGDITKIKKLFEKNPSSFVGLKFHPQLMQLPADSFSYDNYLDFAQKHQLPCLFHSDKTYDVHYGFGFVDKKSDFSRPEQIYSLAKRHKNVPIILGHMGGNCDKNCEKAIDVILDSIEKSSANLYADISWVNPDTSEKPDIIAAIKRLKNTTKGDQTNRLLFGTDAPLGRFCQTENGITPKQAYQKVVNDIKNEIRRNFEKQEAEVLIEKIFYKNADNLFFSKHKKNDKNRLIAAITLLGTIFVTCFAFICKNKKVEKT